MKDVFKKISWLICKVKDLILRVDELEQCCDGSGGAGIWGQIQGELSNQTDLKEALDEKTKAGDNISLFVNDEGYLKTETDPTVPSHVKNITTNNIQNWNSKLTDISGYIIEGSGIEITGVGNLSNPYQISIQTGSIPRYFTELTDTPMNYLGQSGKYLRVNQNETGVFFGDLEESDPTVPVYVKQITQTNISNWNTAFGWGNHALAGYLKAPTTTGDTDLYQYVVGEDGSGGTARLMAGDLGKNIGNSNLSLTEDRTLDFNQKTLSFKGVGNKETNATFNKFLGSDNFGEIGYVGYHAFKNQVENWTEQEKIEYGQLLNGGFAQGSIAVNLITPPVFEKEDNDVYVVVKGANLNLHPTQRRIEIIDAVTEDLIVEVPISQVQTYASGTELVFYYNYNNIGEGEYKLRITSGVNVYITTQNFRVVSNVSQVDLSSNSFDILTSYNNTLSFSTNRLVQFENEIEGSYSSTPIFSAKSSEIFQPGDDWVLEVQLHINATLRNSTTMTNIAIAYSSTNNELAFSGLNSLGVFGRTQGTNNYKATRVGVSISNRVLDALDLIGTVMFIKQGNQLTVTFEDQTYTEVISNNEGYSLLFQAPNRVLKETTTVQILKAYKF